MNKLDPKEEVIFNAARQFADAQKLRQYLDLACKGEPELRLRIDRLLGSAPEADAFFGRNAALASNSFVPDAHLDPLRPGPTIQAPAGAVIGRYHLLEKIGEGGMGEVWMAEQREPVKRHVAVKIIKPGMDSRQIIARFEAERQALAMMDHPNIARIFDAGATDNGRPYFVMELVRGTKITEYCDANQLPTGERLKLFILICQAIQHAHQKGIIHRDLKPSNILVALQDGVPVPKVIDFGIAKATEGRLADATVSTQLQQFLGTPAYMSPEQAGMTALDIDTRSDIYSLGVLLYELLTGHTPFDAHELAKEGLDAIRRTIREVEAPRPSARLSTLRGSDLTATARQRGTESARLRNLIRGDLDWIVMKCLEKDRSRRYDTANGLAVDLRMHMQNEPVLARPPSASYRLQKAWRRNRSLFAGAALLAAVLMVATGISVWQAILARERLAESQQISKFMTEVFRSPDPALDGRSVTVASSLASAARRLESDLAKQPGLRARLQGSIAKTYHELGLDGEAIPLQEKVRDYYQAIYGAEHPDTLAAMSALGASYYRIGRLDEALKLHEKALELRRKVNGPEHPDTLTAMNALAVSYYAAGRYDEAFGLWERVLPLRRRVLGPEHPDTLDAMENVAVAVEADHQAEALKLRTDVLTLRRKVLGLEHPDTLAAMHNLAHSFEQVGQLDQALKLNEEALPLFRKVFGPEHHNTLIAMANLANSYEDDSRRDEALRLREQVLSLRRKVLPPGHPDTLDAMENLAISFDVGRHAEALELREEVLALRRKFLAQDHPDTLTAMGNLAISYDDAGRWDEALRLREQVLALSRSSKARGPENIDTLSALADLAVSYGEAGRCEEAIDSWERLVALRRKVLSPDNENTLSAMINTAASYDDAGRGGEALKLAGEALALCRKVLKPDHACTLSAMRCEANCLEATGRGAEALKLREEVLALSGKGRESKQRYTIDAMSDLATSLNDAGRRKDAVSLQEQVLALRQEVLGRGHPDTLWAQVCLANSYDAAGRNQEAAALRLKACEVNPRATDAVLMLATWQAWFGQGTHYEATRRRLVEQTEVTAPPLTAECAAVAYCLSPSTDPVQLAKALDLARRAVQLDNGEPRLPWCQLALGLAQYRNGHYANAERALSVTEQKGGEYRDLLGTARLFRAMCLFRQHRLADARSLLSQAEAQMTPPPKAARKPLIDGKPVSHNTMICWLAYKEAKALITEPAATP